MKMSETFCFHHGDTEARRTVFFVLSLTLGRFGELSGNCPIRFLFSRTSRRMSLRFRHRIVVTKNPRGFVIQSNKNPEIDATMESQVSKAAGPGAPGRCTCSGMTAYPISQKPYQRNIPALRFAIERATRQLICTAVSDRTSRCDKTH